MVRFLYYDDQLTGRNYMGITGSHSYTYIGGMQIKLHLTGSHSYNYTLSGMQITLHLLKVKSKLD